MYKLDIEKTSLVAGGASNRDGDLFRAAKEGAIEGALFGAVIGSTINLISRGALRRIFGEVPFFPAVVVLCAAVNSAFDVLNTYFAAPVKDEQN